MNSTLKLAFALVVLVFALLIGLQALVPSASNGGDAQPVAAEAAPAEPSGAAGGATQPSFIPRDDSDYDALRDLPTDPSQAAAILQNYKPGRMPTAAELNAATGAAATLPPELAGNSGAPASGTGNQPSFKPGEPMIDPDPR